MATTAAAQPAAAAPVQEKGAGSWMRALSSPAEGCQPAAKAPLTAEQQTKYDWLLEQARAFKEVPSHKDKGGPITDDERMWLTRECLLRYLRATKWHQKEAEKRLLETLAWRREYGVAALTPDYISPEQETGKQLVLGYDKDGRVCNYLSPGRQNTEASPRQVEHLVFMLERDIDLLPANQETIALLINFKQSKNRSYTAPGIGMGREVLHILQTHYPERLGRALIINVPWVVWGFFKLITPFIDPLTREKIKFNEDMNKYVPSEQLWTEFNGKLAFDYDHATYWTALNKLCEERRAERKRRWEAGGKLVGEHEAYLVGHDQAGAGGATAAVEEKLEQLTVDDAQPAAAAPAETTAEEPAPAAEQ